MFRRENTFRRAGLARDAFAMEGLAKAAVRDDQGPATGFRREQAGVHYENRRRDSEDQDRGDAQDAKKAAHEVPPDVGGVMSREGDEKTAVPPQAIAFFRLSSTLSRKPPVVSHFWSGPTSSARSLVMKPLSTVAIQTFSSVPAKVARASLPSSLAR